MKLTRLITVEKIRNAINELYDKVSSPYPVGSIYMSFLPTSPAILFGGTWEAIPAGHVLLAQGESEWGINYTAGSTGGEATHTLTEDEMPAHDHPGNANSAGNHKHTLNAYATVSGGGGKGYWFDRSGTLDSTQEAGDHSHIVNIGSTGGGQSHNNMPPYLAVYCWKRTA